MGGVKWGWMHGARHLSACLHPVWVAFLQSTFYPDEPARLKALRLDLASHLHVNVNKQVR